MSIMIAPSILSADFLNLESEVRLVAENGADYIHFDVMDGHFVPNLTLGVPFVKALKKITDVPLDVHLMIDNPNIQVPWYLEAGADLVVVHIEATDDPLTVLNTIHGAGVKAGLSLNPETPVSAIEPYLSDLDLVLVMSVHPGFGGQSFIPESVQKVSDIVRMCKEKGVDPVIEVDGGISVATVSEVARVGATMFVAGSAIFGKEDRIGALNAIRLAAEQAL